MSVPPSLGRFPVVLFAAAAALAGAGCLGIGRAEQLAGSGGRFLHQQLFWCGLAVPVLLLAMLPPYSRLARWSYAAYAVSLVLLLAVYCFPPINGAHRWIRFGAVGLQPSEFAKLALVVALARYFAYRPPPQGAALAAPLLLVGVPLVLVLKEPDLGTALVFPPLLATLLWAAGARVRDLALLGTAALLMLPWLWSEMSREQKSRIVGLLQQTPAGQKPTDDGYQLYQSKRLLALGGAWGSATSGEIAADHAAYHLPEAHTDFVFSVLGERYGLLGTGSVLLFYTLLVTHGVAIAERTRDPFGRLLAVGATALLAIPALINTGMTVGLLPVTGLSLPLVSYGGSGLLANALALGLLGNVALRDR